MTRGGNRRKGPAMARHKRSDLRPARPPGHRRVRAAGILLISAVLLALLPQNAALAHGHPEPDYRDGYAWYTYSGVCEWGFVEQWHYKHHLNSQTWVSSAGRPCYYPINRGAGGIQHRAEYFKSQPWLGGPYQFCYGTYGWYRNQATSWYLDTVNNWDIWGGSGYSCNWGAGVYVDISLDFMQKFSDGGYWIPNNSGTAWRPATHHCHCP